MNNIHSSRVPATLMTALVLAGCGAAGSLLPSNSGLSESSNGSTPVQQKTESVRPRVLESAYETQFVVKDRWSGGYTGELKLTYRGIQPLANWKVSFDLPATLNSVWNARLKDRSGNRYTLENETYNSTLTTGQTVTIGFVASFTGSLVEPTSIQLDEATPAAVPAATSNGALTATFTKNNDWGTGFVGSITVKNTSAQTVSGWNLSFRINGTLDNLWNGVLTSQLNGLVSVKPPDYSQSLAPGQTLVVGFQGKPGNPQITELTVTSASSTPTPAPVPTPTSTPPAPPAPPVAGFLHSEGARLLDSQNRPVVLRGVNWFGMETNTFCPHGLWIRSLDSMLDQIKGEGYNCLRLPFSNELLRNSAQPNGINYSQNPDLQNLTGVQILDKVIAKAGQRGLMVILDRHRPNSNGQSALWYDNSCSEAQWLADWELLANRYKSNPTVIGCDLHNEPHDPATWGDGNAATDWRLAAEKAGNRILTVNPQLLIVVEGVSQAGGSNYWWGGNLKGASAAPVRLQSAGHLVYSPHDYPASVFPQSWFSAATYPANLNSLWDQHWGYLAKGNIAPVLLGEFGTRYETQSDRQWLNTLVIYLQGQNISSTYWSWNPNSGDTGGLLKDDWQTLDTNKKQALLPLLQP